MAPTSTVAASRLASAVSSPGGARRAAHLAAHPAQAQAQAQAQALPRPDACRAARPGGVSQLRGRQASVIAAAGAGGATEAEADADAEVDASFRVKLMLAASSGRLDLSECQLSRVPPQVFEIESLEELSLAGNQLTALPPELGRLTSLRRLQLSGNELTALPPEVCALTALEGLWAHGNRLAALPQGIGALQRLTQLSLSGNDLASLPEGVGALAALRELSAAGNRLAALPAGLGRLAALEKLSLHGNDLAELPPSLSGLGRLRELWAQGNPRLSFLPGELGALPVLQHASFADCALAAVPSALGRAPALLTLALYGNQLRDLPAELLEAPSLRSLWVEGNPLLPAAVAGLLRGALAAGAGAGAAGRLQGLGLDSKQAAGAPADLLAAVGERAQVCEICGAGPGYFKLERGPAGGGGGGPADVLVVAFGSAPGVPNWGGLLRRVRAAAADPRHNDFDVLYVVDPHRSWYGGGDAAAFGAYRDRLAAVTRRYGHVVMIGDSMGATGALLFAGLASAVHAFCPQVDLARSSIRPSRDAGWHAALQARVGEGVAACAGRVVAHVGNWKHDLDQVNALAPGDGAVAQVYSVDSHRLALALDHGGRLLPLLRAAILHEMGLPAGNVRAANLL
jgi:hypothetical protein